jgi:chromosome segregation ATPase
MSYGEEFKIDADSFPSFLHKIKIEKRQRMGEDAQELSFDVKKSQDSEENTGKEQIRAIEFEKKRLEIDLEALKYKSAKEKEQFSKQIKEALDAESAAKAEIHRLQDSVSRLTKQNQDLASQCSFFESQIEFLNKEAKRVNEQYRIDKENWELKLKSSKRQSKPEEKDESKTKTLLGKAESKILELKTENQELKAKNESQKMNYQKKIEHVESEVRKLKVDEAKYIKDLEIKIKDYEETIKQLNRRIKEFEVQGGKISEKNTPVKNRPQKRLEKSLSVSDKLSNSSKSPLFVSPKGQKVKCGLPAKRSTSITKDTNLSAEESRKKTPIRELSSEKSSNAPTARVHNKAPSYLRKENQTGKIEVIEKEIAGLTGRYKYLLQMSQDAEDLVSLKNEISKVASEIEDKSNQLFELKKKQQDYLRQQSKFQ